jgi:Flp pilus assembly protein CpaB
VTSWGGTAVQERTDASVPESSAAKRPDRPRWRDSRLVIGVVLILVSVLLGARLLGGAQQGRTVVVAARPLVAGHLITAGDLTIRSIRLSGVDDRYWSGADAAGLIGHPVTTTVASGDLVARSAIALVASPTPMRIVSVPVDPARAPALHTGDRVDVFATYGGSAAAATATGSTVVVLKGAEYLGGGDARSGTTVALRLRVPVDKAAAIIRASQVAKLDVALQEPSGDDPGDVDPGTS